MKVPVEAYSTQVGRRKGDIGWIENLDFWATKLDTLMHYSEEHGTHDDLPDINIKVTDYTVAVSTLHADNKQNLQSHSPVLEPPCGDGRDFGLP
jgi:hypothetical protein